MNVRCLYSLLAFILFFAPALVRAAELRQPDRNVPYTAKGPASERNLFGIPICNTPDTTVEAGKYANGMGWRVINTGTLDLFLDKLPYLDLPHQEWAKPYHGGKLTVLYINTTYYLGEAAMLEQRGDLDVYIYGVPVYLDWFGDWRKNTQLVAFLIQRMKDALAHNPDVIIANGCLGSRNPTGEGALNLPEEVHQLVLEKVKTGAGLVLIPSESTKTVSEGQDVFSVASPLRYKSYTGGKNAFKGTHPLVDGVPLEVLNPAYYLISEAAPGAEAPVTMNGQPFFALGKYGRGRVIAFDYTGLASIPDHPGDPGNAYWDKTTQRLQDDAGHWYEYAYSLLLRSILWAGNKEPRINVQVEKPPAVGQGTPVSVPLGLVNNAPDTLALSLAVTVRNSDYEVDKTLAENIELGPGEKNVAMLNLGSDFREGRHLVDVIIRNKDKLVENWASIPFTVTNTLAIEVKSDKEFYAKGDTARLTTTVETAGLTGLSVRSELWDLYGRLMATRTRPVPPAQVKFIDAVDFPLVDAVGAVFEVKTSLLQGAQCLETRSDELSIPRYDWGDDWRNKMWSISSFKTDALYRAIGIDDMTGASFPHRMGSSRVNARGNFPQHLWSPGPHPAGYYPQQPGDDQMHPPLLEEKWRLQEEANIKAAAPVLKKYGAVGISLSGEAVCAYETSFDPLTLAAFNDYLRAKYQTLDALNAQWGTQYTDWAQVGPIKTVDWKANGTQNFSQWMEFRRFMDRLRTEAHLRAAQIWRRELGYPVRVGQEQTFGLWQHTIPYGGFDYYAQLSGGLDCWYSYEGSDSGMLASSNSAVYASAFEWLLLTSWCTGPIRGIGGWPSGGLEGWGLYDGRSWSVLLNGGSGMDWYEPSMFLAGYGALLPGGAAIYRSTHEIKSGIGKAIITAQRKTDPVAIWQDMTNEYAGWLLTGPVSISRWDVVKTMYAHGIK
ncbi:MAG TPA: beta-galactosidase, partial [Armatimonadota bacterium]